MTTPLKAAILRHWELDRSLFLALAEIHSLGIRGARGTVLDALLEAVATLRDFPSLYVTLVEFSILEERNADARLLWRTIERRIATDPSWTSKTESSLLAWLIAPDQAPALDELGKELLAGPAPLRRAFLPLILQKLRALGHSVTSHYLVVHWLAEYPSEPDAWWSGIAHALETHDHALLAQLLAAQSLPREPETTWQWTIAFQLAFRAPEPHCWTIINQVIDHVRKGGFSAQELRSFLEEALCEYNVLRHPKALLISLLFSGMLGETPSRTRELLSLSTLESPVERGLAAALVVQWLEPAELSPALIAMLEELLEGIQAGQEFARFVQKLETGVRPLTICEYALRVGNPVLTERALAVLVDLEPALSEFLSLASRLDIAGSTEAAIEVLRVAARQCRHRLDRVGLLRALRALVQLDPRERAALEFVVSADTRSGRFAQAIDTLLATANRAAQTGDPSLERELLERAATVAELADDRPRLALIAELLAESDAGSVDRHLAAATALLRAGQGERARAQLWAAIRIALEQRRLDEALVAAEQLAALDPNDEAAAALLNDLRALRRRIGEQPSVMTSSETN